MDMIPAFSEAARACMHVSPEFAVMELSDHGILIRVVSRPKHIVNGHKELRRLVSYEEIASANDILLLTLKTAVRSLRMEA